MKDKNINSWASSLPHQRTSSDFPLPLCLLQGHAVKLVFTPQARRGPSVGGCRTDPSDVPMRTPQ